MTTMRITSLTLLLCSFTARLAGAQASCSTFGTLAEQALAPAVGSPGLVSSMLSNLAPWTADRLSTRFDPKTAALATGELLKAERTCPSNSARKKAPGGFACTYRSRKDPDVELRVEMASGTVDYLNAARRFDPAGPDNPLTGAQAIQVANTLAAALGVPEGEIDAGASTARARMLFVRPKDGSAPSTIRRTELFTTLRRKVNGFPVVGSTLRVAVDRNGAPARAHLAWPDFSVAAGAFAATPRTRAEMVQAIVDELGGVARNCTTITRVAAYVGWIDRGMTDPSDDETNLAPEGRYVPGLFVRAFPRETPEDSGQLGGFLYDFAVPLVGTPAAEG